MKRYFDLSEKRVVAQLEIVLGSTAATAKLEEFQKFFGTPVREVEREEYQQLKREYERQRPPVLEVQEGEAEE
jgi:hypothetical protein